MIGFLHRGNLTRRGVFVAALQARLARAGLRRRPQRRHRVPLGRGRSDRLRAGGGLVRRKVDVIVRQHRAALAAKRRRRPSRSLRRWSPTPSGPASCQPLIDPAEYHRSFATIDVEVPSKRIELLQQFAPPATSIALIVNPKIPHRDRNWHDEEAQARLQPSAFSCRRGRAATPKISRMPSTALVASSRLDPSAEQRRIGHRPIKTCSSIRQFAADYPRISDP